MTIQSIIHKKKTCQKPVVAWSRNKPGLGKGAACKEPRNTGEDRARSVFRQLCLDITAHRQSLPNHSRRKNQSNTQTAQHPGNSCLTHSKRKEHSRSNALQKTCYQYNSWLGPGRVEGRNKANSGVSPMSGEDKKEPKNKP